MSDWGDLWPAMRQEAHFGDRVVTCFQHRPHSLYALLQQAFKSNPAGEALVCGSERLSYAELVKQSSQLATGLARRGIKAGDRVAMLLGVIVAVLMESRHFSMAGCKRLYVVCQRSVVANVKCALFVKCRIAQQLQGQLGFARAGRSLHNESMPFVRYARHPRG